MDAISTDNANEIFPCLYWIFYGKSMPRVGLEVKI